MMSPSTLGPSTLGFSTSVLWAQTLLQGALVFELRSRDAEVLARAERIFSPYRTGNHLNTPPLRVFEIEPHQDKESAQWVLRSLAWGEEPEPEPQLCATLTLALANVEFAAVHAAAEYATVATHAHLAAAQRAVGLHGALLYRAGKGVLIVGVHEAGKSTLACGLWQAGWSLLTDDYALLAAQATHAETEQTRLNDVPRTDDLAREVADRVARPLAHAIARRVSLRPTSRALLGEELWQCVLATPASDQLGDDLAGRTLFHPHQVDGSERLSCVPLHAIVLLQRPEVALEPGETRRLDASRSLFALLPHCGLSHRAEVGAALRAFGPLVGQVPTFDMKRGSLPLMVTNLNRIMDAL